jgi:hypothetical protein
MLAFVAALAFLVPVFLGDRRWRSIRRRPGRGLGSLFWQRSSIH